MKRIMTVMFSVSFLMWNLIKKIVNLETPHSYLLLEGRSDGKCQVSTEKEKSLFL